jgi:hypothetical protein
VDDAMRERVWARWVEIHPYDADADETMKAALLGTYLAHAIAFRFACEDVAEPFRAVAVRLADDLDARYARLRDEGLRAALRATR